MYNSYRDLNTRIILNNALKVTLDIIDNVSFPPERVAARASTMNLYIISSPCATGKPRLENIIKASWNSILVDARIIAS